MRVEVGKRSKIEDFPQHFGRLDKNIATKSNFVVNKMIELAHIFFDRNDSIFLEGERTMAKAAKKATKKATAKRAPAKRATAKRAPAKRATTKRAPAAKKVAAKKPAKKAAKKKKAA